MSVYQKKKKKKCWRGGSRKELSWSSSPFLTSSRELISLNKQNKQKLRAPRLVNRLALCEWKAGILEQLQLQKGWSWGVGSPVCWWCIWGKHFHWSPRIPVNALDCCSSTVAHGLQCISSTPGLLLHVNFKYATCFTPLVMFQKKLTRAIIVLEWAADDLHC